MYGTCMSSNYVTYVHRKGDKGEIDAAVTLKIRSFHGAKYCWIEFIRALPPMDGKPEISRPIPEFMIALDAKLGPHYDLLLLQVHEKNKHAIQRFKEKYGLRLNKDWNNEKSELLGMTKEPEGEALQQALVRRKFEAKAREDATKRRREKEAADLKKLKEDGSKRPRRETIQKIDYSFPASFKIVPGHRDSLPNWAKARNRARILGLKIWSPDCD